MVSDRLQCRAHKIHLQCCCRIKPSADRQLLIRTMLILSRTLHEGPGLEGLHQNGVWTHFQCKIHSSAKDTSATPWEGTVATPSNSQTGRIQESHSVPPILSISPAQCLLTEWLFTAGSEGWRRIPFVAMGSFCLIKDTQTWDHNSQC